MDKFSYDTYTNVMFTGKYSDVSEPLKEYTVDDNLMLHETPTSCTMLGVKSKETGKWGWIDYSGNYVISPDYDSGWILCYNDIIILQKNGLKYGGLYRNTRHVAFDFKYDYLGHLYRDVYLAHLNDCVCVMKPGEVKITGFDYLGITLQHEGPIFGFTKRGLFGGIEHGWINVLTGVEQ